MTTALEQLYTYFGKKDAKRKRTTSGWGLERVQAKRRKKRNVKNKIAAASRKRNK